MKICDVPVPFSDPDYSNYDSRKEQAREAEHQEQVKAWLIANGYTGPHTGSLLLEPMADGYAQYMYADAGRNSCLIFLPYGDRYHSPNVQHLPKREVLNRIQMRERLTQMFSAKEPA